MGRALPRSPLTIPMRYAYLCDSCGAETDVHRPMAEAPQPVTCACGVEMHRQFNGNVLCCVKGGERPYKLDHTSMPIGWDKGNTGEAQERRYRDLIGATRKEAIKNDRQAIKGGIRHIASVPREFARMRMLQYGKDYLDPSIQSADELKGKLKSDGLLFKN